MKNKEYLEWQGPKIKKLREDAKLTQPQVASRIYKTRCAYASYEECRAKMDVPTLQLLCKIYHLTVQEFLEDCPVPQHSIVN